MKDARGFDTIGEATRLWQEAGWHEAAPGMAVVTSLMRAQQIVSSRVEATLKPFGITFARFEVLMLLQFSRRGTLPMGTIGARLQVHPASVTNAVDRLEKAGLVQRTPHPSDGRTTLVAITRAGRSLADDAATTLNDEVFTDLGLSQADNSQLVAILTRLRQGAGDF